jgi:uncharacterized protein (DUF1800 family)
MRVAMFVRATITTVAVALASGVVLPAEKTRSNLPANPDAATIVHVLNRLGFGPAPGDVERVRGVGLEKYIEQQLHPERIADQAMAERLAGFETLAKSSRDLADHYFIPAMMERRRAQQQAAAERPSEAPVGGQRAMRSPDQVEAMRAERQVLAELSQQKVLRAAYSERQLEEVMVDFWFNHFNVYAGKGATRLYLTEYERDAIRPRVFGKFRDLLGATAQSPAMLFYLDNWQSSAPEGSPRASAPRFPPDRAFFGGGRNRARIGARRGPPAAPNLSQTAPNRRPSGLNENYARELMELHTLGVDGGYTQRDVQEVARAFTGWTIANPRHGGGFKYEARMHDDGEKVVLGHRLKRGGGKQDAEQVLDILATHPSTAHFIATKLARHFVADEPPASLVNLAAARFRETGGDIREVVRAIVTSPEFFARTAYRAKVKTPFEFVSSAVRAVSADTVNAQPLAQAIRDLGMPAYQCQPPTGYADRADAWVNTGALLNRMNFAVALTSGRMRGIRTASPGDVIIEQVLAGDLSEATRSTVARATDPSQMAALLLGSPEFQKR